MSKRIRIVGLLFCLCSLLIVTGCDIQIGDWGKAKYERTVQRQAPLAPGSTVVAETSFGSVTITGADVTDCNVVAQIRVKAPTEEEAQKIAEQVKIKLEQVGNTLTVKAEKPPKKRRRSISISYDITVPGQTNVECASSYGAIKLSNIDGNVKGDKLAINLVNTAGPHGNGKVYVFDDIPAVGPLSVAIRHGRRPKRVTLEPFGREVDYTYRQGKIHLNITRLAIHNIIVVE